MRKLTILTAGALAAAMVSSSALAYTGVATGNVNLRTDDYAGAQRLTTIPEGARVEVHGCPTWCNVTYRGVTGWASSNYIAAASQNRGPRVYYNPDPRPRVYHPRRYRDHSWRYDRRWRHRRHFGPGFGIQFGF